MNPKDYGKGKPSYPTSSKINIGSPSNRVLPRQVSTGSTRGSQRVGFGNTVIDGSNNRITLGDSSGSTTTLGDFSDTEDGFGLQVTNADGLTANFGVLSDGTFGFEIVDADGFVLFRLNGETWYWFSKEYDVNQIQLGKLPDGTYNLVIAKTGKDVDTDIFNV